MTRRVVSLQGQSLLLCALCVSVVHMHYGIPASLQPGLVLHARCARTRATASASTNSPPSTPYTTATHSTPRYPHVRRNTETRSRSGSASLPLLARAQRVP